MRCSFRVSRISFLVCGRHVVQKAPDNRVVAAIAECRPIEELCQHIRVEGVEVEYPGSAYGLRVIQV
jgi:hypothetical protein